MRNLGIFVVLILLAPLVSATGPKALLDERNGDVVVVFQNFDESQVMRGNATLTLPQGYVETFEFSLKPQEKREWVFSPKGTGYALLNARYYLGEEGVHTLSLTYPVTKTTSKKAPGFEVVGLLALLAILVACLRRKV